jgi:hypothetical protein
MLRMLGLSGSVERREWFYDLMSHVYLFEILGMSVQ